MILTRCWRTATEGADWSRCGQQHHFEDRWWQSLQSSYRLSF